MTCPIDNTPLAVRERRRGELDKIIERANADAATTASPRERGHAERHAGWSEHGGHGKSRKRSFLSEMFEGD